MNRDPLLWAALVAVLIVLASAEYSLAVACGFGVYVAAGVPAALDIYAVAALRAGRDVPLVVAVLIAVNAASHLVEVGLLPVSVFLVVAVSAIAPFVLLRVHRLGKLAAVSSETPASAELAPEPSSAPAELAEPITVEREPAAVSGIPDTAPVGPVLGPWTPLAELAGGTSGTSPDVPLSQWFDSLPNGFEPVAEPAPEPVPPTVPPTGTGAADIETEDSSNTTFAARVGVVREWLRQEPELTGTEIGTRLGVSDGYGRRLLRTAREGS